VGAIHTTRLTKRHQQYWGNSGKPVYATEQPATHLGQEIKKVMDVPTSMIEREIKKTAMEKLKEFKPKGKPN